MPTEINLTPTGSSFQIADDGQRITGRTWGTASECRSACLLIHGLAAHSGWFEGIGRRLKVRRIFALTYDQVGFGKRINQRFSSRQQWLSDLRCVYQHLKEMVGDKPVYLLGNSMGAVVALAAGQSLQPSGLILASPGFEGYPATFTPLWRLRVTAQAFLRPDTLVDLPYTNTSRDKAVERWLDQDQEKRFRIPALMLLELLRLNRETQQQAKQVDLPLMMLTAGLDRVVDNRVNAQLFAKFGSAQKKHRHFPEAYHDLMFDPVLDDLVAEVADWMSESQPEKLLTG